MLLVGFAKMYVGFCLMENQSSCSRFLLLNITIFHDYFLTAVDLHLYSPFMIRNCLLFTVWKPCMNAYMMHIRRSQISVHQDRPLGADPFIGPPQNGAQLRRVFFIFIGRTKRQRRLVNMSELRTRGPCKLDIRSGRRSGGADYKINGEGSSSDTAQARNAHHHRLLTKDRSVD